MVSHVISLTGTEIKMVAKSGGRVHSFTFYPDIKKIFIPLKSALIHVERDANSLKLFFEEGEEIIIHDFFSYPENQWPDFILSNGNEISSIQLLDEFLFHFDDPALHKVFDHGRLHLYDDGTSDFFDTIDGVIGSSSVKNHSVFDLPTKYVSPTFFPHVPASTNLLKSNGAGNSSSDNTDSPKPDDPAPPLDDGDDIQEDPFETIGYLGRIVLHSIDAAIDQISCYLYDSENRQFNGGKNFDPESIVLANDFFVVTGYDAKTGKVFFDLTRAGRTFALENPDGVLIDYATFFVDGRCYSIQLQLNRYADYDSPTEDAKSTQIGIAESDFIGEWHYEANATNTSIFSSASNVSYNCMGSLLGSEVDFSNAVDVVLEVGKSISNSVVRCGLGRSGIFAKEISAIGTSSGLAENYIAFTRGVVHVDGVNTAIRSENGVNHISGNMGEIVINCQGNGVVYGLYAAGEGYSISSNTVILAHPEAFGMIRIYASSDKSHGLQSVTGVFAGKNALNVISVEQGEIVINVQNTSTAMGICSIGGMASSRQPGQKFGNLLIASNIAIVVSGSSKSTGVFASEGGMCEVLSGTGTVTIQVQAQYDTFQSSASGVFVSGSKVVLQSRELMLIQSSKAVFAVAVDCIGNNGVAQCSLTSFFGEIKLVVDGMVAIGICGKGLVSTRVSAQKNFLVEVNASKGYACGIFGQVVSEGGEDLEGKNSTNRVAAGKSILIDVQSQGDNDGLFVSTIESPLFAVGMLASGSQMSNLLCAKDGLGIKAVSEYGSAAGLVAEENAVNKLEHDTGGAINIIAYSNTGDYKSSVAGTTNAYGLLAVGGSNYLENGNSTTAHTAIEALAKGANSHAYALYASGATGTESISTKNIVVGKEGSVFLSAYSAEGTAYCMFAQNGGNNVIDCSAASDGMRLDLMARSPDGAAYGMYAESDGKNTIQGSIFGDTIHINGSLFSSCSFGGTGGNQIFADDGDDYIHVCGNISGSSNLISGGNGNDTIILEGTVDPGSLMLRGGQGDDVLVLKATDIDTFFDWYDAWISSLSPEEVRQMSIERIELQIAGVTELDERLVWLEDYFGEGKIHVIPTPASDQVSVQAGAVSGYSASDLGSTAVLSKIAQVPAYEMLFTDTDLMDSVLASQKNFALNTMLDSHMGTEILSSFSFINTFFHSTEAAWAYSFDFIEALSFLK